MGKRNKPGKSYFDQYSSRVFKHGTPLRPDLVAEIYFPTAIATLDNDDCDVLDALIGTYRYWVEIGGGTKIELRMVGHADVRGSLSYNYHLGAHRAAEVKRYVDAGMVHPVEHWGLAISNAYSSTASSIGEWEAGHSPLLYATDRRVDIFSSFVPKRPPFVLPQEVITGRVPWPLSRRFAFHVLLGGSVAIGPLGGQAIGIEIKNCRTGRIAQFTYTGLGPGANIGINRTTDWEERDVPLWMDLEDFEGKGRVAALSAGPVGGTVFIFEEPRERRMTNTSITLTFTGWDLNVGDQVDKWGYWHKW